MSARLNVVIVQSPRMSSLQVGIVAEIVIQLLGRPGIDVAMVESLEPEDESTDRLMLTGLENDLAVLDWRSVEQTVASLQQLNVPVTRAPHTLDVDVPAVRPGARKLYGVDLRNGFRASEVVESLANLLEQRQVVTVSLLGTRTRVKQAPLVENQSVRPSDTRAADSSGPNGAILNGSDTATKRNAEGAVLRPPKDSKPQAQSSLLIDEASLDDLVDDLNRFD